jgi:hypothetical protein
VAPLGVRRAVLVPHPSTPVSGVCGVFVSVAVRADGALALSFSVEGGLERLRVPVPVGPRRADGLWRHTCFEAFVMAGIGPAYGELNFSPSGEWAAYAFRRYRDGGPLDVAVEPAIVVRHDPDRLQVDAVVPAAAIPSRSDGAGLRLGLAAVLENVDGALSHWALRHPADRPDFHHADGFVLEVPFPGADTRIHRPEGGPPTDRMAAAW